MVAVGLGAAVDLGVVVCLGPAGCFGIVVGFKTAAPLLTMDRRGIVLGCGILAAITKALIRNSHSDHK